MSLSNRQRNLTLSTAPKFVQKGRQSLVVCQSFFAVAMAFMALPCGLRQWAFATLEIDTGYPTSKGSWVEMVLKLSQHMKENMIYKCNFWSWFGQHQPPGRRRRNFLVSLSSALSPRIGMTTISLFRNFNMAVNQIKHRVCGKYESRLLICDR